MLEGKNRKSRGLVNLPPSSTRRGKRCPRKFWTRRLKGDGQAVELEVDEVAGGVASLAAGGDVGAAGLLDGDGHYQSNIVRNQKSEA